MWSDDGPDVDKNGDNGCFLKQLMALSQRLRPGMRAERPAPRLTIPFLPGNESHVLRASTEFHQAPFGAASAFLIGDIAISF